MGREREGGRDETELNRSEQKIPGMRRNGMGGGTDGVDDVGYVGVK